MGVFEMDKFAKGTIAIAEAIEEATKNGSFSLVGGGDSVAAVKNSVSKTRFPTFRQEAAQCSNHSKARYCQV